MNKTQIEWVKNPDGTQGFTWNPITGCLNGCEYCYARKLANTRLKERYLANHTLPDRALDNVEAQANPFYPRFWPDRLKKVYNPIMPVGIFVCDMSDLFGIGIPEEWTRQVLDTIKDRPHHRFYLLTKQPQNLIKFSPFPDNCWVGVSATNSHQFIEAHKCLIRIPAKVKYISFEPLLEQIKPYDEWLLQTYLSECCDWVIIGSQTKPYKPPKIKWVREIVQACDKAGIPVFLKDNLHNPLLASYHLTNNCWNKARLRQEMPKYT